MYRGQRPSKHVRTVHTRYGTKKVWVNPELYKRVKQHISETKRGGGVVNWTQTKEFPSGSVVAIAEQKKGMKEAGIGFMTLLKEKGVSERDETKAWKEMIKAQRK